MFPTIDAAMGLSVSRADGAFSGEDRAIVELVAPHILRARRNTLIAAGAAGAEAGDEVRYVHWEALRPLGFSRRECQVLEWLGRGKTDEEIAAILGLGKRTVSHHVLDLLGKLGAPNRVAIVGQALRALRQGAALRDASFATDARTLAGFPAQIHPHLIALSGSTTPAAVARALSHALTALWPGRCPAVELVKLGDPSTPSPITMLDPTAVRACVDRLMLFAPGSTDPAAPRLGPWHALSGQSGFCCFGGGGYLREDLSAPAEHPVAALVFPPQRVALALRVSGGTGPLTRAELFLWRQLIPHAVLALRTACHALSEELHTVATLEVPEPDSPQWCSVDGLGLTPREGQVLGWVASGRRDQDIAILLGVSARTVNAHLRRVFEQLGVENRTTAVVETCRYFTLQAAYAK
jgi:DNA-binding CsgD family transcriptional regulator